MNGEGQPAALCSVRHHHARRPVTAPEAGARDGTERGLGRLCRSLALCLQTRLNIFTWNQHPLLGIGVFFGGGEAGGNDRGKCASSAGRVPGKEQALRTCWSSPPAPRRPDRPSERRLWPQSVPGFRVGEKPCYKFASEPGAGCLLLTAVVPFPRPVETGLEFSGDGGGGSGGCCALGSPSGKGGGHCPSCF